MKTIRTISGLFLLLFVQSAFANTIFYTVDNLGGNRWEYNYTLENTGADPLEAFSIFFDLGVYENLTVTGSAADWDSLVFQPDPGLPDDGIFDSLSLGGLLNPGDILGGFSVAFDFLGIGMPADQFFEFYDPVDFSAIVDGLTIEQVRVPEPATLGLLLSGLLLLAFRMRRKPVSRAKNH